MTHDSDWRDRLMHQRLRETLGGDVPRDLSLRVLRAARGKPGNWAGKLAAVAAALLLVALGSLWLVQPKEPALAHDGPLLVEGGGPVRWGVVVATKEAPATLHLSASTSIGMAANTRLLIGSDPAQPQFELRSGQVDCKVAPSGRGLAVNTPAGVVRTLGTQFQVTLAEVPAGTDGTRTTALVRVREGKLALEGPWGTVQLLAGGQCRLPLPIDQFARQVALAPPATRAGLVAQRLRELHPKYDGQFTHLIQDDEVREFALDSTHLVDLAPLAALPHLWRLDVSAAEGQRSGASDLKPLAQFWNLIYLNIHRTAVADLGPLRGKPLAVLLANYTAIRDLEPLRGSPLQVLHLAGTPVRDLGPLRGLAIKEFSSPGEQEAPDLSPLLGAPLTSYWGPLDPVTRATLRQFPSLKQINGAAQRP